MDPDLHTAYGLKDDAARRQLYQDWATSYEADFADARGYQLPFEVARVFTAMNGSGPILDVGAGTGLVGAALKSMANLPAIEALDLSPAMLAIAAEKDIYTEFHDRPLADFALDRAGRFESVVSAGTFTIGHLGAEGLAPIIDLLAPGGLAVLSIHQAHFDAAGFGAAFEALDARIEPPILAAVRIYDGRAGADQDDDLALIATFRKRDT